MQVLKIITKGSYGTICWCTTNTIEKFRDFMQYVLDNYDEPNDFIILNVTTGDEYNMYKVATELYKMKKRSLYEKVNEIPTGQWIGELSIRFSDDCFRTCECCGKLITKGYTNDVGDFYNCEQCFTKEMDNHYGKGNWRAYKSKDGNCNSESGFYEYLEDGEWKPESSYYTEWN